MKQPSKPNRSAPPSQWAEQWKDKVARGESKMSQRKLSSIDARGGGLSVVKTIAEHRGVHLLLVTDDHGNEVVAASTEPFTVLC